MVGVNTANATRVRDQHSQVECPRNQYCAPKLMRPTRESAKMVYSRLHGGMEAVNPNAGPGIARTLRLPSGVKDLCTHKQHEG